MSVHGEVAPGYEAVRRAFEDGFEHRGEIGAACAAYVRGEKVVDLWGGIRDHERGLPWEEDTLVLVFSTTKGMAATALAVAHARDLFDLDERVSAYWPDFAQNGKSEVTVRQLLAHQAGLCCIDAPLDARVLADLDRLAGLLAAQRPAWPPGREQAYHSISLGFYENELMRRIDPKKRSIGRFFHDEIAKPLGIDFHIGLPPEVPPNRLGSIKGFRRVDLLFHLRSLPPRFALAMMNPRSHSARSLNNPKLTGPEELDTPVYRAVEMPASNGIGSARAIARVYSAMAMGGAELGVGEKTLREITAPATPRRDRVLHIDTAFSFGFLRPTRASEFGSIHAFGTPGAGGSFGFADPDIGLGFAYVMNRMGFHIVDDPREKALRDAVRACATRR
jgi:CubicO group peptidase (beta-lactamase class C family)